MKSLLISTALVLTLTLGACENVDVQSYVDSVKDVVKDINIPDYIKNIEITPIPDYDPAVDDTSN